VLILVSGATVAVSSMPPSRVGHLFVPTEGNVPRRGRYWAMDNGAYHAFNPSAFLSLLERLHPYPNCLFVAAPDVVGDASATLCHFRSWADVIHSYALPVALVGQDGLTVRETPWGDFEAFFIGGTTEWKLGREARTLAAYAKAHGKWTHMGRVNSKQRLHYAMEIGCDSVDGSQFSKWSWTWLPRALAWIDQEGVV